VNPFRQEALAIALLAGIGALAAWLLLDIAWALALLSSVVLLYALHHLHQVSRLLCWLDQPTGTPLPSGGGAWDRLFAGLHRRARQAAEESQQLGAALERFSHAWQALPDGVVILDMDHAIEWINATAEDHLGLNAAQDVGCPITNLLREPDFVRYIEAGAYAEPLILHPLRNPGRVLALQVVPYGAAQKLLLSRDITQLDKLETMRRDFVANVSHELKTPLTVVSGFLETLLDGFSELTAEEVEQFLTLARQQALRMQRLIEDLLTLSALETGSPPPSEERVSMAELLAEVVDEAKALSGGRHQIELEAASGGFLLGSRSELRSVMGNLASNAVRYTPANGRVRISWKIGADGGGVFSVCDNGMGIESHHIARLTERFYRVDRGRSSETGGTGLGLAIVKHALTRHQGVLEISSELGRGSCFSARFPPRRVAA
jgi:two-component system phosphate regulon sensor histidine kinase PhoR